jgi:hypothetical protein
MTTVDDEFARFAEAAFPRLRRTAFLLRIRAAEPASVGYRGRVFQSVPTESASYRI